MNTIKAIETRYAGCRFRSRLEARWAVFFDKLKIPWDYEPQGFDIPATSCPSWTETDAGYEGCECGKSYPQTAYLPDFWLPKQHIWFEVKGQEPADDDPWWAFAHHLDRDDQSFAVLSHGPIPDPRRIDSSGQSDYTDNMIVYSDFHYAWARCHLCGSHDIRFDARAARNYCSIRQRGNCDHSSHGNGDKCYGGDAPELLKAYEAARSARFEHGEQG